MSGGRAEIAPSGDARIAMKSPKTGRRKRVRSDVRGRTARGEIMLEQRTRREPLRECELDGGGDPLRKTGNRRCRPDIGATSGGASQNAAKAVMLDRISTRSPRTGSVQGTSNAANFARKSECWLCVPKTKSGRSGDEVRPGRRVISPLQRAERRENAAHPCSMTYES